MACASLLCRHASLADWRAQEIIPTSATTQSLRTWQLVARANLIFGLHVHIGIESRETAIQIMNAARYFIPHIPRALDDSPFWLG